MAIDGQIGDEKLQYDIAKEAAKQPHHQVKLISMTALQVKKYYLIKNIIEQAKFTYSRLGKAFEKQTIEGQRKN